jgi:dTMP kinase
MERKKLGRLITLEGVEGAGKSTAIQGIQRFLEANNIQVELTREPGGTEIAEHIRQVLLSNYQETMIPEAEALLMFASRAQHVTNKIRPALESGRWVISDRFTDASYAYQGGARGLGFNRVKQLKEWVLGDFEPDLTFLLDIPLSLSRERIQYRQHKDRIEQEDEGFFLHVREMYLHLAKTYPKRYCVIDAKQGKHLVSNSIIAHLEPLIQEWKS